ELNNRHYLKEIESIIVNGDSHYIGIIDIDYFKKVNDSYGHTVGDKIIKSVASIIKTNIRSQDYALRIGGEEFAVIIKSDQISVACEVLERIRLEVERTVNKPKVTVSAGIAPIKRSIEDSINVADQFLYIAKNAGRNQIRSVPNCC
ncbi:GGDEF domain-containing protein, partial [Vibrio sp. FNV 38]|nr:GGDEF domain-containing protein [Vibrio sp. FNV 38]